MSDTTFMGVERNRIDWSPRIDYGKCNDCMDCMDFCPHQVFEKQVGSAHQLAVKNPDNCVVFCRACGKTCGPGAITFPDKAAATQAIKAMRREDKES
ncbi:4Fe-4S binding domain-containing protein [Eubacterium limosum]|nr:4Fe-4S binding domain-containing protein [Eubacterium limosum]